jgi:hypothetical protein
MTPSAENKEPPAHSRPSGQICPREAPGSGGAVFRGRPAVDQIRWPSFGVSALCAFGGCAPSLVFHSQGDATVPLALTRASVAGFPAVELVEFPPGPHTLEWNRDRQLFERSIRGWLERMGEEGAQRGAR